MPDVRTDSHVYRQTRTEQTQIGQTPKAPLPSIQSLNVCSGVLDVRTVLPGGHYRVDTSRAAAGRQTDRPHSLDSSAHRAPPVRSRVLCWGQKSLGTGKPIDRRSLYLPTASMVSRLSRAWLRRRSWI